MFNPIGGRVLIYIGGSVRFIYGTLIRNLGLTSRKRYTWKEYIWGVDETGDFIFDRVGHEFVNRAVGIITIMIIGVLCAMYL